MRGWIRFPVMFFALLVGILWMCGLQTAEAIASLSPVTETSQILDYLTASVPEIREMARKNPANKLVMSVESMPDPKAADRAGREFYQVYVGFNVNDGGPGHRSRWATFLVHKDKTEILWANYLAPDSYVPLSDWRKYIYLAPAEGVNDWMCIPFLRAGPIQPDTSLDDLKKMFGHDNVQKRTIDGPEGIEKFEVSVIFPDTPNEMIVFWLDNKYASLPAAVSLRKQGSAWKTVWNLKVGSSLAELNRVNGRPFSFYGFGWDCGGFIAANWNGGAMASVQGVRLILREIRELPRKYYGDRELISDMKELLPDSVQVHRIDVILR